jgi:hypothetical protein
MQKNFRLPSKPSGWRHFSPVVSPPLPLSLRFCTIPLFSRDLVSAYLPADQNHVLMKVAGTVMELHSECVQKAKLAKATAAAAAAASTSSSLLPAPPPTAASSTPPAPPIQSPPLLRSDSLEIEEMTNMLNKSVLADPAGTIFSTTEHVLTEKRNFDDDLIVSHDEDANSSNHSKLFFAEKNAMKYSGIDVRNTKSMTPPRQVQSISDSKHFPLPDPYPPSSLLCPALSLVPVFSLSCALPVTLSLTHLPHFTSLICLFPQKRVSFSKVS